MNMPRHMAKKPSQTARPAPGARITFDDDVAWTDMTFGSPLMRR